MSIGAGLYNQYTSNYGIGSPVLIATQTWTLLQEHTPAILDVKVQPESRHWNANGTKSVFDVVQGVGMVIPEPITMTMLGMGLSSLGMMVWRRRKETV
jgi:hypothetical protein